VRELKHMAVWPRLRSQRPALLLLLATLAVCLVRAPDQPGLTFDFGGSDARVVVGDLMLLVLGVVALLALVRSGLPRRALPPVVIAIAFSLLMLGTAAANGAEAFVAAVKFVELAALGLGALALVRARSDIDAIADVLVVFTLAADAYGVVQFIRGGGGRQSSFLGEHDFAALATLPLVYGIVLLFERPVNVRRATLAIVAGAVGCVLGAALASLIGLYLGVLVLVGVALARRAATARALLATVAVVAVVTTGTLVLRAGELGFLQQWFGKPPSRPGQYAASWSQRLIYAYVGGRVFLAHPLVGTGWYGELPPRVFVEYLPDARRRFSDQPPRYFPRTDTNFVPQQAWDQVLYELGAVGAALFVALFVALAVTSLRATRRAFTRRTVVPAAWIGANVGALAGDALFGGTPLGALFWLVSGLAVATAFDGQDA
jgi:hypothetical protein